MTLTLPPARPAQPGRASRADVPAGGRRLWRSGWIPAAIAAALVGLMLLGHGVSVRQVAVYSAYAVLAVVLPGTLLWRALRGGASHLAEDLAAGTALGYALTVPAYLVARWAGRPLLFLAVPVATVAAFAAVPALRRHWRGSGLRMPVWWSWPVAAVIGLVLLASGTPTFEFEVLRPSGDAPTDIHLSFHLALTGELKHHMPPSVPYVLGEPLHYHWFACAELAAESWATGLDPLLLLTRLSLIPMIAALAMLLAALGRRLTGRLWAGPLVLVLNHFMISPGPPQWSAYIDGGLLSQSSIYLWMSPTQTLAALLFGAAVLVLTDCLRRSAGSPRRGGDWALLGLLLPVVMGTKATFLPLLLGGLVVAGIGEYVLHRRVRVPVLAAAAFTAMLMLVAQIVLYGGGSQGMTVRFGPTLDFIATQMLPWYRRTPALLGTVLVVAVLGWCGMWAGVAGLFRRARRTLDPAMLLLIGIGGCGIGAALFLAQPGTSQFFFTRGADPYLAVAAVCGLAVMLPAAPPDGRRRAVTALALAGAAGTALALVFRTACDLVVHIRSPYPQAGLFLVLLALAGFGAVVIVRVTARREQLRRMRTALVIVFVLGLSVPATVFHTVMLLELSRPGQKAARTESVVVSRAGFAAARWLRGHSAPSDVVATNAHCVKPGEVPCTILHFWISAFAERRVLVEGWGFTESNNAKARNSFFNYMHGAFWDPGRLAANDAAFTAPTAQTLSALRRTYGVRWLFADERVPGVSPALGQIAVRRFHQGEYSVYEITG